MQWLINIIKEWVDAKDYATEAWVLAKAYATEAWVTAKGYITTAFVDRGDYSIPDFSWFMHDFFPNMTFDLDLSGIIPSNAKGVLLRVTINYAAVSKLIRFRTKGNVWWNNVAQVTTQVASVTTTDDIIVAPDSNGIIEANVSGGVWGIIFITVAGWWL